MIEVKLVDNGSLDHPSFVCLDANDVIAIGGPPEKNSHARPECIVYLTGGLRFLVSNRSYAEMVSWWDTELNGGDFEDPDPWNDRGSDWQL